jgi:hypothetical protein
MASFRACSKGTMPSWLDGPRGAVPAKIGTVPCVPAGIPIQVQGGRQAAPLGRLQQLGVAGGQHRFGKPDVGPQQMATSLEQREIDIREIERVIVWLMADEVAASVRIGEHQGTARRRLRIAADERDDAAVQRFGK